MTLPVLIAISIMWLPLAIFFLGKGEAKSTGATCGLVGIVVVVGAILQAAIFKDGFTAGLLFAHGLLYIVTSYALVNGIEDLRTVGNVGLTVAIISFSLQADRYWQMANNWSRKVTTLHLLAWDMWSLHSRFGASVMVRIWASFLPGLLSCGLPSVCIFPPSGCWFLAPCRFR